MFCTRQLGADQPFLDFEHTDRDIDGNGPPAGVREEQMTNVWDADVELTPESAARLIAQQFPPLPQPRLQLMGTGWDNVAYLVNEHLVFRFPRRQIGAQLIAHEVRILPLLAPYLPLPIPVPLFIGNPDADYPYPFAGYEHIPGETACHYTWTEAERAGNAAALARFLAALHRIPVSDETRAWAPGDDIQRADLRQRATKLRERIHAMAPTRPAQEIGALLALVDQLVDTPASREPPCWVHGDLYARHLLVDAAHQVCGVIDWGDVHLGDPAIDLSIAWSFLPAEAHATFREAYGPIEEATWNRARFRALHYGAVLVDYGSTVRDKAIQQLGEYALRMNLESGV